VQCLICHDEMSAEDTASVNLSDGAVDHTSDFMRCQPLCTLHASVYGRHTTHGFVTWSVCLRNSSCTAATALQSIPAMPAASPLHIASLYAQSIPEMQSASPLQIVSHHAPSIPAVPAAPPLQIASCYSHYITDMPAASPLHIASYHAPSIPDMPAASPLHVPSFYAHSI